MTSFRWTSIGGTRKPVPMLLGRCWIDHHGAPNPQTATSKAGVGDVDENEVRYQAARVVRSSQRLRLDLQRRLRGVLVRLRGRKHERARHRSYRRRAATTGQECICVGLVSRQKGLIVPIVVHSSLDGREQDEWP